MSNGATKVLIFSTAYFPFVGGAEVAVKEITDRISDIQFDLITARMDRKLPSFERIGNINVYRMGFGWGAFDKIILAKWGFLKALKLNKKNNYDIAWSIMASQASIAASLFSAIGGSAHGGKIFNKKIKLILTLQEGDEEEYLARYVFNIKWLYKILIRPWHLSVFKKADKITAISNYLKERAIKNGVKVPVEIVPNGVNIEIFDCRFSIADLDNLKNSLGIKEGEKVLITTSRLVKKNAVEDIIEAMRFLLGNIKLLILGEGPLKTNLELCVTRYALRDRVIFLGQIENKEIPKYLKISDIFIRPSLSEGLGNSFLEAMAADVPVIGTSVGGIPDFLHEGETGLFCEVNNPEGIAEKVKMYFENSALREKIIVSAKQMVEEKYNWNNIAEKMRNILN
jgi:glycosyltransferase involved in cell wall biosynthesis